MKTRFAFVSSRLFVLRGGLSTTRLDVRALLGLPAFALFAFVACGGSVAPGGNPGSGGAAGSSAGGASGSGGTYAPGTTTGGTGAAAGNVKTLPACIPGESIACACSSGESGAQVCGSDGTYAPCICHDPDASTWDQQQLARVRNGIVGTWAGTQTNPWGSSDCATTITFEANGHYSAHSPGETCVVFYYGSNDDSPQKTYLLDDVLPTTEAQGEIVFWFGPDDTNAGQLRHVSLSADDSELKFEAWKGDYGPFTFTLKRVSP